MLAKTLSALLLPAATLATPDARPPGDPVPVESRVRAVGLFKNGLAVVRRTVTLPKDGRYEVADVPDAVHGTLWIESDAVVEARVTHRDVEVPADLGHDLHGELAGRTVSIQLRGDAPAITGRVAGTATAATDGPSWDRSFEQPHPTWGWWGPPSSATALVQPVAPRRFLVLESDGELTYVDTSSIVWLRAESAETKRTQRRQVLVLEASGVAQGPATVRISYLQKGMAWAPSYRVDLSDPKSLMLRQQAVLKNELGDLEDVEMQLISGFPSVEFSHVRSPLSLATTWAEFFRQLGQRFAPAQGALTNVMSQAVMTNYAAPADGGAAILPSSEGVDLHYHDIGQRSLAEGDSLMLEVAEGEAAYDRIVEWIVPDTRDANGRWIDEYHRRQDPERYEDAAWDAVRFRNPLSFPMTTAPALVVEDGRFCGQRQTHWVNPGEETTLRITKALSLRTRSTEHEEPGEREVIRYGGQNFRRTTVTGELLLCNHRKEAVSLVIRRQFSGDLLEADGEPEKSLREEGVYSVNPRHELVWKIALEPGVERTLRYRYDVLVAH
jgi:hypothetical protein